MTAIWSAAGAGGEWRGNKYNSGSCSVYSYNSQHRNLHQNTAILASVCSAARSCLAVTSSTSTPRPSTRLAAVTTIVTAAARGDMATTLLRLYCLYCLYCLHRGYVTRKQGGKPPLLLPPSPPHLATDRHPLAVSSHCPHLHQASWGQELRNRFPTTLMFGQIMSCVM